MSRIAITGAAGTMASSLRPRLRALGHDLVLIDIASPAEPVGDNETFHQLSVTEIDGLPEALVGTDVVIHLAGYPRERPWDDIVATNIRGGYNILEAGRSADVTRFLLASSVHAVGYTPIAEAGDIPVFPPRPDTLYGVGKVALEALGSAYADRYGMTVVSARILNFAPAPTSERGLGFWFSPDDFCRLAIAVLNLKSPGHHIVWGVSRNARGVVSLDAGEAIGFFPVDDAEAFAASIDQSTRVGYPTVLGGPFVDDAHPMGVNWS